MNNALLTVPTPNRRILVVDDNPAIHDDMRKVLNAAVNDVSGLVAAEALLFGAAERRETAVHFELTFALQGQEALAKVVAARAAGQPFAVAFVDVRMPPGWDGIETIGRLWREQPDLQIVLCTAYSDYSWEDIRRVLGESDGLLILKKPFDNVEVMQLAHTLTKKWGLARQVADRLAELDRLVHERTQQTQQTLAMLEASIAQSPAGILIAEAPNATVSLANAAALSIRGETALGLSGDQAGDLINRWTLCRPDGSAYLPHERPWSRAVQEAATIREEEVLVRTERGEERWISINAAPIRDSAGTVIAGIAVLHDTTERKRMEGEKAALQAQLVHAQKMESVGRLAGGVAHDFNNMLTAILGNVELAIEEVPRGSRLEAELLEVRKAAQRSADLTRQLLAFARKGTINPVVLCLNETVSGMLILLRRLVGEDIRLEWSPSRCLWPVKVDAGQIDQVLANLSVNARDAIAGVGVISVATSNVTLAAEDMHGRADGVPGDYVVLTVTDTGCGMDAEIQSHLFEPFFTTKGVGKGTGLGLAMVYGIVNQSGGFIEVLSAPQSGTTFKVFLPRLNATVEPTAGGGSDVWMSGTETVLLVEDEPQVLKLGQWILNKGGYTVMSASTPAAALELVADSGVPIHLLLTDVVMPEMNGRELSRRIREVRPGLKCLFMSGYTADVLAPQGILDGKMNLIQKPFQIQELLAKVRQTLDGEESPA